MALLRVQYLLSRLNYGPSERESSVKNLHCMSSFASLVRGHAVVDRLCAKHIYFSFTIVRYYSEKGLVFSNTKMMIGCKNNLF